MAQAQEHGSVFTGLSDLENLAGLTRSHSIFGPVLISTGLVVTTTKMLLLFSPVIAWMLCMPSPEDASHEFEVDKPPSASPRYGLYQQE